MTSMEMNKLREIVPSLTDEQLLKFTLFMERLLEKNKVMNLTAITDPDEIIVKHFYDSLSLAAVPKIEEMLQKGVRVFDLGTGAGFPGVPLKIAFPSIDITLCDSVNKKLSFVGDFLKDNFDSGFSVLHSRAEDCGCDCEHRGKYDIVVSRAVANLSTLLEYCLPLVKTGGYFVSYKGAQSPALSDEISGAKKACTVLGGTMIDNVSLTLPLDMGERSLIIFKKQKETPSKYPRKAPLPKKDPL